MSCTSTKNPSHGSVVVLVLVVEVVEVVVVLVVVLVVVVVVVVVVQSNSQRMLSIYANISV